MPSPVLKRFTVEGRGEFPADMLRTDQCWPASVEAASGVAAHYGAHGPTDIGQRAITLETAAKYAPNRQRWLSFGWRVLD